MCQVANGMAGGIDMLPMVSCKLPSHDLALLWLPDAVLLPPPGGKRYDGPHHCSGHSLNRKMLLSHLLDDTYYYCCCFLCCSWSTNWPRRVTSSPAFKHSPASAKA